MKNKKEKIKTPRKAARAIDLLDKLVGELHYFYGNSPKFRTEVLNFATEIEGILKELAVNKTEAHHKIATKYKKYYEEKLKEIEDGQ